MASNLDLIIIFSFLLGIISIFVGILIVRKVAGKLKTAMIFLVIAELIFTIGIIINLLNVAERITLIDSIFLKNIINLSISLFLLFTFISLLFMIKGIRRKHK